jgi:hypothetical protein
MVVTVSQLNNFSVGASYVTQAVSSVSTIVPQYIELIPHFYSVAYFGLMP